MKKINNMTFLELWNEYDNFINIKLKPQSYRKQAHLYNNNIVPYFKDYLVKDITVEVYIDWMQKMENNELMEIKGGAVNWGLMAGIGAAASFIIGIIDGWMNPKKCNG